MDDGEWKVVSRRRTGSKADRKCSSISQHLCAGSPRYNGKVTLFTPQGHDGQNRVGDCQPKATAESVASSVEHLKEELRLSDLWGEVQLKLAEAVSAELQSVLGQASNNQTQQPDSITCGPLNSPFGCEAGKLGDKVAYSLVCLGLGSPTECNDVKSCRYQLALALLLQRLLAIPSSRVHISDPVMNELDLLVLDALSLSPCHDRRPDEPLSPTSKVRAKIELVVYLAPHCDADLYGDILGVELELQPFCSSCFSCAKRTSWDYRMAGTSGSSAPRDLSTSRSAPRGFVLIGNVLSSYEMRRSFFGELRLDEFSPICSYGGSHFPFGSEIGEKCPRSPSSWSLEKSECAAGQKIDIPNGATNSKPELAKGKMQSKEHYGDADREATRRPEESPNASESLLSVDASHAQHIGAATTPASADSVPVTCHWVTPSRGASLLLELLPFVSEWPLERPFPAHPPAFNDLAVSTFPAPRTEKQRATFWEAVVKSSHSSRGPQERVHRIRRRQKEKAFAT